MKQGLIVFAREPLPGRVKSRLASEIGKSAAAELYEIMLRDTIKTTRQLSGVETFIYWACEEAALPRLAENYSCNSKQQGSGNLGQRMQAALEEMFADGFHSVCVVGSDAPDLPPAYIQNACQLLATLQADVVFGPCKDGGYYLLGLRQVYVRLFENISWSTSDVLEQSLAAARNSGLETALLPEWQDIDTFEDLRAFQERNRQKESGEIR